MVRPDLSIIVPCLNEEQNISGLVHKLKNMLARHEILGEIIIVDDSSDDYTFREALAFSSENSSVRALHKDLPHGYGDAVRFGIEHARGKVGVIFAADQVDPLTVIPQFREHVLKDGYDLVFLSRYDNPADYANIPLIYRFYHFWYCLLCRMLLGIRFRDVTYAFRGFNLEWIRTLNLRSRGFELSPEIMLKAWLSGASIYELKGRQGQRLWGKSKFFFSRVAWGYLTVLACGVVCRLTERWPGSGRIQK